MHKSSRQKFLYNKISYNNNVIITMSRHIQNPGMFNAVILIFKMMRHIESPGIVRTVYSDIFRHI